MKKMMLALILIAVAINAEAMSDLTQAVVVTSTAGLINAGTAIYMQNQGMNPQFVMTPNGTTVVPGAAAGNGNFPAANQYQTQNQQADKQAFFEGS